MSRQLGDAQAELQGEQERIERARKRQERVMRDHAAGRITAFDIARMDLDEGDPGKVDRLQRRVDTLRRQLEDVSAAISPGRFAEPNDPLEAASRRAHDAFMTATRAQLAGAQQPRRERPFVSGGGAGCAECQRAGATAEEAALIHGELSRTSGAGYGEIARGTEAAIVGVR